MPSFDTEPPLVPLPLLSAPSTPSAASVPAPPQFPVLYGPLGLRAGWGMLIFVMLLTLLSFGFNFGIKHTIGQRPEIQAEQLQVKAERAHAKATHTPVPVHPLRLETTLLQEGGGVALVLLAALGTSFAERRRFAVYGLRLLSLRDLLPGALWGLASMSLLVTLLHGFGLLVFDSQQVHGTAVVRLGLAWLGIFLLVGLFEEFLFRGYIQFTLTRGLLALGARLFPQHARFAAFWMSALVWSALFFAAHASNPGENPAGLFSVFAAGLLFSYALWRTGSLWWGIGFHMTWDWAQSFLFGVPDSGTLAAGRLFATHAVGKPWLSGGVDGPEGSVLGLGMFLLMFLAIRLQPLAPQPPVEPLVLPLSVRPALGSPAGGPIA